MKIKNLFINLRTNNTFNDSEVDKNRKEKDINRFDKFVIYESKLGFGMQLIIIESYKEYSFNHWKNSKYIIKNI